MARGKPPAPEFTEAQVGELRGLGLTREEIGQLQEKLILVRATTAAPPPVQDVRNTIQELERRLHEAYTEVERLLTRPLTPAEHEAMQRIADVGNLGRATGEAAVLHSVREPLHWALNAARRAQADLPPPGAQARGMGSSMGDLPVTWLHEALVTGWKEAHAHLDRTAGHRPQPPSYLTQPASTKGRPFRRVMDICYRAALGERRSAERAIKDYMKFRSELRARDQPLVEDSLNES